MSVDLSTKYLGMTLKNPITVASCPLTGSLDHLLELQEAGVAAIVLPSLFEEQIEHDELELARLMDLWALSSPESPDYFPELDDYNTGPNDYLDLIRNAKQSLEIPVIASLNGVSLGGWVKYAGLIEQAGADALELNIYQVPISPDEDARRVEDHYIELIKAVRENIQLPIAVKVGPFFSSLPSIAKRMTDAGADGIVCFNRYRAPDIDLDELKYVPALELSNSSELRLAIRWVAILRDQLPISLAASGGVHSAADILKSLLAGADVIASASAILEFGPKHISDWLEQLSNWLEEHEYESVQQMCGSLSMNHCPNPGDLQRANYMRALVSHTPSMHYGSEH